MIRLKLFITISIFSLLLIFTSVIKNQTRIIEKDIIKIDRKILALEKDLHETELDYFYLSSPNNLSKRTKNLALVEYVPMDFSKIYLSLKDFTESKNRTTLRIKNETKKEKN